MNQVYQVKQNKTLVGVERSSCPLFLVYYEEESRLITTWPVIFFEIYFDNETEQIEYQPISIGIDGLDFDPTGSTNFIGWSTDEKPDIDLYEHDIKRYLVDQQNKRGKNAEQ